MTDKVQLIKEEIERQKLFYQRTFDVLHPDDLDATIAYAHIELLDRLLQFIDSLPEESASEDLEEEIDRFEDWLNNFNQSDYPTSYTVRDIARHFAEWQKKKAMQDFLEKAEEAISQISRHFIGEYYTFEQVWEYFKNYMQYESED